MQPAEAIAELVKIGRGERPTSLTDAEIEKVLNIATALLIEQVVAQDRIDRLEREVARLSGTSVTAFREAPLDADASQERRAANDALIARVLRIVTDPRTR